MTYRPLPLPGQFLNRRPVIASGYISDDEDNGVVYGVMTLNSDAPFYTVAELRAFPDGTLDVLALRTHENIVPAAQDFEQFGFYS
jgi:hypothetical protein